MRGNIIPIPTRPIFCQKKQKNNRLLKKKKIKSFDCFQQNSTNYLSRYREQVRTIEKQEKYSKVYRYDVCIIGQQVTTQITMLALSSTAQG